ncbi:uncharacterized protein [Prorops nasuta]
MMGHLYSEQEVARGGVNVKTEERYYRIDTRMEIEYWAPRGRKINCVIGAAVHLNGFVSVEEGGVDSEKIRIRYETENQKPDTFYLLIQTVKRNPVVLANNAAFYAKYGIVYDPIKDWINDADGKTNKTQQR